MGLLAQYGVPQPAIILGMIWLAQLKVAWGFVVFRHALIAERRQHLALSPGEQYRRTLASGGYRP